MKSRFQGDGGSPLICPVPGKAYQYQQVGIVAWGIGCGNETPAAYVNVAKFRNWIDNHLQRLGYRPEYNYNTGGQYDWDFIQRLNSSRRQLVKSINTQGIYYAVLHVEIVLRGRIGITWADKPRKIMWFNPPGYFLLVQNVHNRIWEPKMYITELLALYLKGNSVTVLVCILNNGIALKMTSCVRLYLHLYLCTWKALKTHCKCCLNNFHWLVGKWFVICNQNLKILICKCNIYDFLNDLLYFSTHK